MIGRPVDWLAAIAGGALLALMINYNSLLAKHTTPTFASWVAHGLGAVAAFALVALSSRLSTAKTTSSATKGPLWYYLGGIPGAFTVLLAAITVNSRLSLSGSIALMLVGQVVFGIVSDNLGLFRTPRRRIIAIDYVVAASVLTGSGLIIFGGP